MMDRSRRVNVTRVQAGFSLIEILIGVLIGLIATAVIFQTFAVSESFKRNTTSAGDAQQNGLFSTFTLALELANAGAGIATSAVELGSCANVAPYDTTATTLRPIPVFITSGASADTPDSFIVNYGVANTVVYPSLFVAPAAIGASYQVQSPTGFAKGDMVVAISQTGDCARTKVTNVSAPDPNGVVTITHSGAPKAFNASSLLFNMGPWDRVQRVRYDIVNGVLRSQDLVDAAAQPNPLASNIVNMKVQYGIDADGDGILDGWVSADKAPWQPADLMAATLPAINQVKAIRIGLIVRSAQYDREITTDYNWTLFDCETHDAACSSLTGTIPPDAKGGGYRYRIYETVVPLRNQLWNRQL